TRVAYYFCRYYMYSISPYFFFFQSTSTTEIYTLSLHDALPISAPTRHRQRHRRADLGATAGGRVALADGLVPPQQPAQQVVALRSEEHTSELQSRENLVCRLLLEKKKKKITSVLHTLYT